MVDNEVTGMSWITFKAGHYQFRPKGAKKSTCQMEIDVWDYSKFKCHTECEGKYGRMAPLRILSYDIECLPDEGKFPTHDKDQIIQIGNIVQVLGENNDEPIIRNIFALETVAPIIGTKVYTFKREDEMLLAWRDFVRLSDPDLFTGYNIQNFDWTYILGRAEVLNIPNFAYFGRIKELPVRVRETVIQSKAMGIRDVKDI